MSSPWGRIDHVVPYCRGVASVSTPSHGGIRVSKGFAEKHLSEAARKRGKVHGGYLYYEEDCDYAIPMLELPHLWEKAFGSSQNVEKMLMSSLSVWNPEYLLERGIEPYEEEYNDWKARKEASERRANKDPDLIVSAASTTDKDVVAVHTASGDAHLVLAASYEKCRKENQWMPLLSKCIVVFQ